MSSWIIIETKSTGNHNLHVLFYFGRCLSHSVDYLSKHHLARLVRREGESVIRIWYLRYERFCGFADFGCIKEA